MERLQNLKFEWMLHSSQPRRIQIAKFYSVLFLIMSAKVRVGTCLPTFCHVYFFWLLPEVPLPNWGGYDLASDAKKNWRAVSKWWHLRWKKKLCTIWYMAKYKNELFIIVTQIKRCNKRYEKRWIQLRKNVYTFVLTGKGRIFV